MDSKITCLNFLISELKLQCDDKQLSEKVETIELLIKDILTDLQNELSDLRYEDRNNAKSRYMKELYKE